VGSRASWFRWPSCPWGQTLFTMVCIGVTLALLGQRASYACGELQGLGGHMPRHVIAKGTIREMLELRIRFGGYAGLIDQ
jgi:hypothetical protein